VSLFLLLLYNAPGHLNGLQKDGIQVEFLQPNCNSWKQPCDQGITNALKAGYKFIYLRAVLSYPVLSCPVLCFYHHLEDKKESLQTLGTHLRRGSAGIEYGNPAHLIDTAKYIKEAWDSVLPISIENCLRKVDISIQYFDDIESLKQPALKSKWSNLLMEYLILM
jgi:DDE superfamily endonuclease